MSNEFEVAVPEKVQTASKAVNASLVLLGTLAASVVTLVSDGNLSGTDVGTLVTGILGTVTAVGAVWATRNKDKV